jgi:hypothetical protein
MTREGRVLPRYRRAGTSHEAVLPRYRCPRTVHGLVLPRYRCPSTVHGAVRPRYRRPSTSHEAIGTRYRRPGTPRPKTSARGRVPASRSCGGVVYRRAMGTVHSWEFRLRAPPTARMPQERESGARLRARARNGSACDARAQRVRASIRRRVVGLVDADQPPKGSNAGFVSSRMPRMRFSIIAFVFECVTIQKRSCVMA